MYNLCVHAHTHTHLNDIEMLPVAIKKMRVRNNQTKNQKSQIQGPGENGECDHDL